MSPLTIIDVVNAVVLAGGVPVFCDIRRETCGLDPSQAESLIDGRTGAVLLTHLHGQSAGAAAFREICDRRGVRLIEDAAQAFGAVEGDRRLGTIGDAGVYSFGFYKNLSTWRGGMVVSPDRALIERIRKRVRSFSSVSIPELGMAAFAGLLVDLATWPLIFSSMTFPVVCRQWEPLQRRLDPEANAKRLRGMPREYLRQMRSFQGSLGLRQLEQVDHDNHARLMTANEYQDGFAEVPGIVKPPKTRDLSNVYTYFPVQVEKRNRLLDYARARRRDFAPQHLRNCADLPEFHEFSRDCPNARATASGLVLLPTYPRYPLFEVRRNIDVVREFLTA